MVPSVLCLSVPWRAVCIITWQNSYFFFMRIPVSATFTTFLALTFVNRLLIFRRLPFSATFCTCWLWYSITDWYFSFVFHARSCFGYCPHFLTSTLVRRLWFFFKFPCAFLFRSFCICLALPVVNRLLIFLFIFMQLPFLATFCIC